MNQSSKQVYFAWVVCTAFFFFQYMLRVMPNVFSEEILETFKISSTEFGSLGTIYSLTYGLMQIPIGVFLDRFTIRTISIYTISLCTIGGFLSSSATDFWMLQVSRFIIALGSSGAFGMTLKIITNNFEGAKRGVLMGLTSAIGTLGPIFCGNMVNYVMKSYDWRTTIVFISAVGIILLLLSLFIKNVTYQAEPSIKKIVKGVKKIFFSKVVVYGILASAIFSATCIFSDMYGAKFLELRFKLEINAATALCTIVYLGVVISSTAVPYFTEKSGKYDLKIAIAFFVKAVLFYILLSSNSLQQNSLYILIAAIGFCAGFEILCFSAVAASVNKNMTGIAVGLVNSCEIVLNGVYQFIVGYIIDLNWNGALDPDGSRIYTADNFVTGLYFIPVLLTTCFIISLYMIRKNNTGTSSEKVANYTQV